MNYKYYICNPSGNITALVTSPCDLASREVLAKEIMNNSPDCKQVGFIVEGNDSDVAVELLSDVFSADAALCAAALKAHSTVAITGIDNNYTVKCTGADASVGVRIVPYNADMKMGVVELPENAKIAELDEIPTLSEGERVFLEQPGRVVKLENKKGKLYMSNKVVIKEANTICLDEQK